MPNNVPPMIFISGKACCPSGLTIDANATATLEPMIHTPVDGGLLALVNLAHNERISSRTLSASVPVAEAIADAPLVMEAGEMPATAVFDGVMKSVSSRPLNASAS